MHKRPIDEEDKKVLAKIAEGKDGPFNNTERGFAWRHTKQRYYERPYDDLRVKELIGRYQNWQNGLFTVQQPALKIETTTDRISKIKAERLWNLPWSLKRKLSHCYSNWTELGLNVDDRDLCTEFVNKMKNGHLNEDEIALSGDILSKAEKSGKAPWVKKKEDDGTDMF